MFTRKVWQQPFGLSPEGQGIVGSFLAFLRSLEDIEALHIEKAASLRATQNFGFSDGAGGTVTQQTNKSTGVTLNASCGTITMNGAALNTGVAVAFTLTNDKIEATDVVVVSIKSGGTAASYLVSVGATAAGSCSITLYNCTGGNLSEAVVLSFAVIKGVAA